MPPTTSARLGSTVSRFVTAPLRLQTYKNLAYLALAFPLGVAYFVGFVTGGALGFGLLITWVGLPILLVTLTAATFVAALEAWLATALVGIHTPVPAFIQEVNVKDGTTLPGDGFLDAVKHLVNEPSTWTSVVLVFTKFGFGIASFVALVTAGAIGATLLAAPFVYDTEAHLLGLVDEVQIGEYSVGPWIVDTPSEALTVAFAGVVFVLVAINLLNLLARLQAYWTTRLLGFDNELS